MEAFESWLANQQLNDAGTYLARKAFEAGQHAGPDSETLDEMAAVPYRGPFLEVRAMIMLSGDQALKHALLLRKLAHNINRADPDMTKADRNNELWREATNEANELERIGKLAKAREVRERV